MKQNMTKKQKYSQDGDMNIIIMWEKSVGILINID
jgi:hypothetical protein